MSYAKKTLANLQQSLADKISAGVVPTSSSKVSYWNRMLNEGQNYCADILRLSKSTSLTTVSGTIAMPTDFLLVDDVVNSSDKKLVQINKEDSANTDSGVYWITGNHFDGWSLNTNDDEAYTVWYVFKPAEMSATSDLCIIPDPVAVVCYAYAKLRMAQTDPLEDADKEMGECNRRLDEVISANSVNEGGQSFKLMLNA
jgi:hypothetical protein